MTDLGPYHMEDFEEVLKRVAELERKINLLAERVLHYYNHTTPEIEALKQQIAALEKRVHDLEYKGAPLYYERGSDE